MTWRFWGFKSKCPSCNSQHTAVRYDLRGNNIPVNYCCECSLIEPLDSKHDRVNLLRKWFN